MRYRDVISKCTYTNTERCNIRNSAVTEVGLLDAHAVLGKRRITEHSERVVGKQLQLLWGSQ